MTVSTALLCVAGFLGLAAGQVHRPLTVGTSCGQQFSTYDTALLVPDITTQWMVNRTVTCDGQTLWMNFFVPADRVGQQIHVTAGSLHPRSGGQAGRFSNLRFDAAIFGPGMPALNINLIRASNPAVVVPPALSNSGNVYLSVQDQSTCQASKWMGGLIPPAVSVVDGVCTYFDPVSQTYMTVVLDELPTIMQPGMHYVAFWVRGGFTGKLWASVGLNGGVEDFTSRFVAPPATCNCGDQGYMDSNFFEVAPLPSFPEPSLTVCNVQPAPSLVSYCPATVSTVTRPPMTWYGNPGLVTPNSSWLVGCGSLLTCPLAGIFAGSVIRMQTAMAVNLQCNPKLDLVQTMLAHHQGALDFCATLVSASNAEVGLVHFCQYIIERKRTEMKHMLIWLSMLGAPPAVPCTGNQLVCGQLNCPTSQSFSMIDIAMRSAMAINYQCSVSIDFVHLMIPHHQGAIDMCQAFLTSNQPDNFLSALCINVTQGQPGELHYLYEWLKAASTTADSRCDLTRPPYPRQEPCADMLPILPACDQLGGYQKCSCANLLKVASCGTIYAGSLNVNQVCSYTCRACGVPPPFQPATLSTYNAASGRSVLMAFVSLAIALQASSVLTQ